MTGNIGFPVQIQALIVQARRRLRFEFLYALSEQIVEPLEKKPYTTDLWYRRNVKAVDGTGLSMPDTRVNQKCRSQTAAMKKRCFLQHHRAGFFNLATGTLSDWTEENRHSHENRLRR